MRRYRFAEKSPVARVLCISNRDIAPVVSRSGLYEFEDLIGAIDTVDLIAPQDTPDPADARSPLGHVTRTLQRLGAKAFRRFSVVLEGKLPTAGLRRLPAGIRRDYEILFVSNQSANDLYNIGPCARWRSRARVSMCYIDEIYPSDVAGLGSLLSVLKLFDHVFVSVRDTVEPLAAVTGRPCHFLAPSVDTLEFCPYPEEPKRVIDFYAMGNRPPETHRALLRMADRGDWYYVYDTLKNSPVTSHTEHRVRLAEMLKRTRFFLVTAVRHYNPERTRGNQELGLRYFEGAAAGTVLIGDAPCNESFRQNFGWRDSVIPLEFNSGDIAGVIRKLEADPARLERIRRTNAANTLRLHDHVHRWGQILSIAGLEETADMRARRRQLDELAASIEQKMPEFR
ncbi:hypothetical protein EB74_24745 [Mycobacterium sp. SWH-M5]|nr:hypothetical protein EB74_24745 [Mycobacterium sp. SWH-M5]